MDEGLDAGKQDQVEDKPVENRIVQVKVAVPLCICKGNGVQNNDQDQCIDQKKPTYGVHYPFQNL
jgi:hypothetical protein